jgi:methionyl-tRNA formyltransferase
MRIVFAGTPAFAAAALQALLDAPFDVCLVLTQPDRPAGRGLRLTTSAVKQLSLRHGLPLAQPPSLRNEEILVTLRAARADVMVVAAYGLILPRSVLDLFPAGCVNVHASLLPRWRGAAPIQRAILAGDSTTGISIMRMEQGLDTGPVYLARALPILPNDCAGELEARLAVLGARCLVEALPQIARGKLAAVEQNAEGITYAPKITKPEATIDWRRAAREVDRQIRAFNPVPGAATALGRNAVKIWRASASASSNGAGVPGEVLGLSADEIDVACGTGVLKIAELQKAGGKRLSAADFVRGSSLTPGARFGF